MKAYLHVKLLAIKELLNHLLINEMDDSKKQVLRHLISEIDSLIYELKRNTDIPSPSFKTLWLRIAKIVLDLGFEDISDFFS
jgi:hypothetical protein